VLFGAVAVQHGLSVGEAALMSASIYAGASQLVGVELFSRHAAPWLIILSIFAVNFRHVLYSAAVARHIEHLPFAEKAVNFFLLTDPHYAETEKAVFEGRKITFSWLMGMGLTLYIPWIGFSSLGALLGSFVGDPRAIGLDMLLPVYFLGMVMGFRARANWAPVVLASAAGSMAAIKFLGSPWHVAAGAACGILVAVLIPIKTSSQDVLEEEAGI
jgi:predicted branched-subunit amino acid permease